MPYYIGTLIHKCEKNFDGKGSEGYIITGSTSSHAYIMPEIVGTDIKWGDDKNLQSSWNYCPFCKESLHPTQVRIAATMATYDWDST